MTLMLFLFGVLLNLVIILKHIERYNFFKDLNKFNEHEEYFKFC